MKRYKPIIRIFFIICFISTLTAIEVNTNNIFAQVPEQQKPTPSKNADKKETGKPWGSEVTGWRVNDFQPYIQAAKDLEKLTVEFSENMLRLSIDEFSTGIDILEDMEYEIQKLIEKNKNSKNLSEQYYWQEIDRKNREKRQIGMMKTESKMKSITYFVKAINHMDDIQSILVQEKKEFTNFQARLYQVYISVQYDLHNFLPCIPILERYIALNEKNRTDIWAYKYLSSCYGYMETIQSKYRHASEEQIIQYKQKKNRYMLFAAELKYGVDSVQYKHLREIVEQDEKKTEMLNDFR